MIVRQSEGSLLELIQRTWCEFVICAAHHHVPYDYLSHPCPKQMMVQYGIINHAPNLKAGCIIFDITCRRMRGKHVYPVNTSRFAVFVKSTGVQKYKNDSRKHIRLTTNIRHHAEMSLLIKFMKTNFHLLHSPSCACATELCLSSWRAHPPHIREAFISTESDGLA